MGRVREWGQGGRHGWLFGPGASSEISLSEDVVGIDMSEILDLGTERSALLAYLFRRIERVIEDRRPTLIVIDEAWKMLDDPIFEKRLHDWLVTMRKKNEPPRVARRVFGSTGQATLRMASSAS